MNQPESIDQNEERLQAPETAAARPRAVGSPLSMGVSRRGGHPPQEGGAKRLPPPARTMKSVPATSEGPSGVERATNILRTVLPFVQRLLPLLDGHVATTVSNLLAPNPHPQAAPQTAKLDLAPIEDGLAELRSQQNGLRNQVMEQNTSLRRVEDQLEMVREATDRNTLEQQELLEDLKAYGNKVRVVAVVALLLAAAGFLMTLALFLHIKNVLP